jgi:hypothetical protein
MSTHSRSGAPTAWSLPGTIPEALGASLSALYALSQNSPYVFASPLGPFMRDRRPVHLPRFAFFGPHACDDSWRLALLAGFDHSDARSSRALVALATRLAADVETGHGLNLSFFPLVDMAGSVTGGAGRDLGSAPWGQGAPPEIALLEQDARARGYHGFVRIETGLVDDDRIGVRIRGTFAGILSPDLELIGPEETRSLPIRVEAVPDGAAPLDGPLSVADDLPVSPFELTLRIPGGWSDDAYQHAAVTLLERFLTRYRAFQAYGQHL